MVDGALSRGQINLRNFDPGGDVGHSSKETHMPDDKSKVGAADRRTVSASEDFEVRHFAEQHNLTEDQVRTLIETHGNDREALEQAVRQLAT